MLMKSLQYYLCGLLLLLAGSMQAQNGSGFDPSNPAEPTVPVFKYSLTVAVSPSGAGTASGAGSYAPGTTRTISTSANANYTFSHWTLNGERIEAATSFSYTTIEGPMNFVAVYDYTPEPVLPFTPTSPSEPSTPTLPDGQTVDVQTKLTGDVNEDGAVDITDAVAVINVYLTGETSAVNSALADVNGDGSIDITDAVAIINIYLNN